MHRHTSALGRFLLLILTFHSIAFATVWEINVNTGMTPAGRKIPHPTSDQPAYYLPYIIGYQEIGSTTGGDSKPPADTLDRTSSG